MKARVGLTVLKAQLDAGTPCLRAQRLRCCSVAKLMGCWCLYKRRQGMPRRRACSQRESRARLASHDPAGLPRLLTKRRAQRSKSTCATRKASKPASCLSLS